MKDISGYNVIIPAAGFSGRMGLPKMLLPFDKTKTFLDVIIQGYFEFGCNEAVVVVNEKNSLSVKYLQSKKKIRIIVNRYPERERFFSIQTGLQSAGKALGVFIHNVDNPFVDVNLLKKMTQVLPSCDIVVPVFKDKGGHPVLLSKKVTDYIVSVSDYSINFKDVIKGFNRKNVLTENGNVLVNINTMADYRRYGFG
jgi:molybdenum cofactor cytidylyltransferase